MESTGSRVLRVGEWRVNPGSGEISRPTETVRLEVRTMRLLVCLAEHAGEVVSIDELLNSVWSGVIVTPDSVYQAIASLRRLLGDDPKKPVYIATVPRFGYRLIAPVGDGAEPPAALILRPSVSEHRPVADDRSKPDGRGRSVIWIGTVACLMAALLVGAVLRGKINHANYWSTTAALPPKSIAVLPFLDLSEGMKYEEFADGVTEELIDRLSRIPGVKVPAPTASFYFKNKKRPLPEIAKTLDVAYLLDGSVRRSGERVRVAARLVRPDTGYVVWSETYDRQWDDMLVVQDDIAGQVMKALTSSIDGGIDR